MEIAKKTLSKASLLALVVALGLIVYGVAVKPANAGNNYGGGCVTIQWVKDYVKQEIDKITKKFATKEYVNKNAIDWSKPTDYRAFNNRNPQQVITTTPIPYKLCVERSQYIEVSGYCSMQRNDNGTWSLDAAGAPSPQGAFYYVDCHMYCYN